MQLAEEPKHSATHKSLTFIVIEDVERKTWIYKCIDVLKRALANYHLDCILCSVAEKGFQEENTWSRKNNAKNRGIQITRGKMFS